MGSDFDNLEVCSKLAHEDESEENWSEDLWFVCLHGNIYRPRGSNACDEGPCVNIGKCTVC